ncbi:MAG: phosphatidylglycerophosphatase A [Calditrichaeota bacterium]|nr:MAG: phosphatidylglycerophosphatase A [Calditrichota bacterium]
MSLIARLIATGIFVGYIPWAPGTAGSLVGLLIFWTIPNNHLPLIFSIIIFLFLMGVWTASIIEEQSGKKDNQIIVIDEIVGMLTTVALFEKNLKILIIGFFLFRFFDILKMYPAEKLENLPGGWGIMMDDIMAGIYAAVVLKVLTITIF